MKEGEGDHWRRARDWPQPFDLCPAWESHVTFWVGYLGALGLGLGGQAGCRWGKGAYTGLGTSQSPPCFLCSEGSNLTPAHHFQDFRFKTYAPVAFRYFRELFGIRPDDYLVSVSSAATVSHGHPLEPWLGGLDCHLLVVLGLHGAGMWLQHCWAPCSGCHAGLGCGLRWIQLHQVSSKPLVSLARLRPCWPGLPFLPDTTVSCVIITWSQP